MEFRDELRTEIKRLGWTQPQTAKFLGVSTKTIEAWLKNPDKNGSRKPGPYGELYLEKLKSKAVE